MDPKLQPTTKRMNALMRRILTNGDGKINYSEFAKLIGPTDLGPYLKRIRKRTKKEDKYAQDHQAQSDMNERAEKHAFQKKPLTAFKRSEVMLNKDPNRHIRLMPMQFEYTGQLSQDLSQFEGTNPQLNLSQAASSLARFGETKLSAKR